VRYPRYTELGSEPDHKAESKLEPHHTSVLNKMFSRRQTEKKDSVVDDVKQFVKVSSTSGRT